eukprot:17989_1
MGSVLSPKRFKRRTQYSVHEETVLLMGYLRQICKQQIIPNDMFQILLLYYHVEVISHKDKSKLIRNSNMSAENKNSLEMINCLELCRLKKIMNSNPSYIGNINVDILLNDFLYLLMKSNNNDATFEFIYNELGGFCDIETCIVFKRHYNLSDNQNTTKQQIMNKIHCFYRHSFDIGHKLNLKEQSVIDHLSLNYEGKIDNNFIDPKISKINKILSSRRKRKNGNALNQRIVQKYNQLYSPNLTGINSMSQNEKMYSFGYRFRYDTQTVSYGILITPKYLSLKHELTNNDICSITIEQFNREYKKAQIHFDSIYRKQHYSTMLNEYILSLMIYCNFSELQFEFSKTYREENGSKHHNFYYLAKYLKISVQKFGTKIKDGYVNAFYHGIGEQLLFPQYIGHSGYVYDGLGISIYCPLSTSSSILVGMNFTNVNNGLIVQFDGGYYENCKYFSVAWLSDFASESEYLFVQNEELLEIIDIIDVQFGFTNGKILSALKIIQTITKDGTLTVSISDAMQALVCKMIRNQLPHNLKLYKSFELSNEYTKQIVTTYFKNKNIIWMNYEKIKTEYSFFFNLLFHVKYEWL